MFLSSLSGAACSRGGERSGAATPTDGATAAATATEAPAGGAPSVRTITFTPASSDEKPTVTDTLRAAAATTDPDGQGVTVTWKWFVNGAELPGQTSDTLAAGLFKKNDRVEAEATPRDTSGTAGPPLRTAIIIRNTPPRFTGGPTGSLNGYRPPVADPDGDKLTWELEQPVPPGFSLSADGVLAFDAKAGKGAGGQKVTIVAKDDSGGIAKQTFDVQF